MDIFLENLIEAVQIPIISVFLVGIIAMIIMVVLSNANQRKKCISIALIGLCIILPLIIATVNTIRYYNESNFGNLSANAEENDDRGADDSLWIPPVEEVNSAELSDYTKRHVILTRLLPFGYIGVYFIVMFYFELLLYISYIVVYITGVIGGTYKKNCFDNLACVLFIPFLGAAIYMIFWVLEIQVFDLWLYLKIIMIYLFVAAISIRMILPKGLNRERQPIKISGTWIVPLVGSVSTVVYIILYWEALL